MKRTNACDSTEFLKHHFPLSEDRIAKLVLPVDLSQKEADRLTEFLDALVLETRPRSARWPFAHTRGGAPDPDLWGNADDDTDSSATAPPTTETTPNPPPPAADETATPQPPSSAGSLAMQPQPHHL